MNPAPDSIAEIVRVAYLLSVSNDPGLRQVGAALTVWLEGGCKGSLEAELGLRQRGGVSPGRKMALDARNAMLCRLARDLPDWASLAPGAAARHMRSSFDQYHASRWPRERDNIDSPAAEPAATWWRLLRSETAVPNVKRLQQILADGNSIGRLNFPAAPSSSCSTNDTKVRNDLQT
ncbi:hypothetical protein [Devosia sp.]|uniref:hypothetical protein n=1 Tax=Devosia sp. TaxID=1871048 RepID=UPI0027363EFF|nr:hypothetical protein [Devosia sp.]MDP2779843.1 hypothetical protein [Devosia sp.]